MRLQGAVRPLQTASRFVGMLLFAASFGLAGCQSSQEQRIEEAKDLIRQKQMLETQNTKPDANTAAPHAAASPSQSADPAKPAKAAPAEPLALPLYPGAKSVSHLSNTGDGIAMELLETTDRIDSVLAFYQEKLRAAAGKIPPSTIEEKPEGKRLVRLSLPGDDGGLQTVEIREEPSKTTIQLMTVSPGKSTLPVPPPAGAETNGSSLALPPPPNGATDLPLPPHL